MFFRKHVAAAFRPAANLTFRNFSVNFPAFTSQAEFEDVASNPMFLNGAPLRADLRKMREGDNSVAEGFPTKLFTCMSPVISEVQEEVASILAKHGNASDFNMSAVYETQRAQDMFAEFPMQQLHDPWILGKPLTPLGEQLFLDHVRDNYRAVEAICARPDRPRPMFSDKETLDLTDEFETEVYKEVMRLGEERLKPYAKEFPFGVISLRTVGIEVAKLPSFQIVNDETEAKLVEILTAEAAKE